MARFLPPNYFLSSQKLPYNKKGGGRRHKTTEDTEKDSVSSKKISSREIGNRRGACGMDSSPEDEVIIAPKTVRKRSGWGAGTRLGIGARKGRMISSLYY
jgi:hypothetical protein